VISRISILSFLYVTLNLADGLYKARLVNARRARPCSNRSGRA
jgi:hypothetical protein